MFVIKNRNLHSFYQIYDSQFVIKFSMMMSEKRNHRVSTWKLLWISLSVIVIYQLIHLSHAVLKKKNDQTKSVQTKSAVWYPDQVTASFPELRTRSDTCSMRGNLICYDLFLFCLLMKMLIYIS